MTEFEKLDTGLEYCYDDTEEEPRKELAIILCREYNDIDYTDDEGQYAYLQKMLGNVGEKVWIGKTFNYANGKNIYRLQLHGQL